MKKREKLPPKLATTFLLWFLKQELQEEVRGDLEEQYCLRLEQSSSFKANLSYCYQVLNYLRPFAMRKILITRLNPLYLLPHHFKISFRNFTKQ